MMRIRPPSGGEINVVRELFLEYSAWLSVDLCFQGFEQELAELPGKYTPPRGGIWLAEDREHIAGVVALRPMDTPERAELKRLWVRAAFRGNGLGRRLTLTAIDAARAAGYAAIRLDTLQRMTHARALYRELGFAPIHAYYENPHDEVVYMELRL